MKKKKVGRPKQGKTKKEQCSIRLEPKQKQLLIKKYGSVQGGIDEILSIWLF